MTIAEAAKLAGKGDGLVRAGSARTFRVAEANGGGRSLLLIDHYGHAAALFLDDLEADDWDVIKVS